MTAPPPFLQTLAGYSALGVEQMAILMGNDAGLPLGGPGFDNRKPDQLTKDLTDITRTLAPYRSFRGWSWSSNWWVFEQRGANAARERRGWRRRRICAAVKQARAHRSGWDPGAGCGFRSASELRRRGPGTFQQDARRHRPEARHRLGLPAPQRRVVSARIARQRAGGGSTSAVGAECSVALQCAARSRFLQTAGQESLDAPGNLERRRHRRTDPADALPGRDARGGRRRLLRAHATLGNNAGGFAAPVL